jgi:cathepsin L
LAGGNPYFWYYKSGILNECYGYSKVDHAAVLVGAYYDLQNLQGSYLKIKNSWGSNWGEEGNVRISLQGGVCSACQYGAFAYQ